MAVVFIGVSALVATCSIGQARTRALPQTRDVEPDAGPVRAIPPAEPALAQTLAGPVLRLASPRGAHGNAPPPQPVQPAHPHWETERRQQPPPAEVRTPSPAPAATAPRRHSTHGAQSPPEQSQAQSPPRTRGQAPTRQATTPAPTTEPTEGQRQAQQRRAQNEQEDTVHRRAQSERQELARKGGEGADQDRHEHEKAEREAQEPSLAPGSTSTDAPTTDSRQGPTPPAADSSQSDGGPMMRAGAPVDRDGSDEGSGKYTISGVPGNGASAASAHAKKPGARDGGGNRLALQLPPPPDSYRSSEFLMAHPSPALLSELEQRHYRVEPSNAAGLARVQLPADAPDAWDVLRELEAAFPGTTLGLNSIYKPPVYKPYHLQDGARSPGPPPTRHELLALIGWEGRGDLAACAAGIAVGMIDTRVDETHRLFAKTHIKTINLALKQDAAPAPHWHATGVLSVMAGLPNSTTPALIPGARFTAVNVFFTNKDGQLETDTAHLTEALAYLDEKTDVRIVNMSLVGPKDDLVHARIARMARNGKVFVGAAGNGGPAAPAGYPAAYAEVIAVTAVDGKGGNWDHANRGAYIDVAAPGVQIRTALPGDKEGVLSGTSFAAPFVTAALAVALRDSGLEGAVRRGVGPLDLKGLMLARVLSKDQLKMRSPVYGHGVMSAPSTCASARSWMSSVKPEPVAPAHVPPSPVVPAASLEPVPILPGDWHASVQQASFPPKDRSKDR